MIRREFFCETETDTLALGKRFGALLPCGAFVALHGDLGAGKTVLVRGIASALGIREVTSPTFTIVQEYDTTPRLLHFDAYRLSDEDELYAIGFDDYLRQDAILIMEWAELVSNAVPAERLDVLIEGEGVGKRRIVLSASGAVYKRILEKL
ncbi:MAG: tRNA (adenosine(37)-N6)-threonylcarbamoyltransferase complex ATPase subunit type 1 TsaE [Candidatus Aphodomorpha sp.]